MLINAIRCASVTSSQASDWPYQLPAVRHLIKSQLEFTTPVTFLTGDNGTGKSTLIEALAESWGLSVRGGHGARRYAYATHETRLHRQLTLNLTRAGQHLKAQGRPGFFLRAESAQPVLEYMTRFAVPGYGTQPVGEISHGEGYLQVLSGRMSAVGLYLLDEPEGALSFESCLALLRVFKACVDNGGQIVCSTHSPVLTAYPGATIFNLSGEGIQPTTWRDLPSVSLLRSFLQNPAPFVRAVSDLEATDSEAGNTPLAGRD